MPNGSGVLRGRPRYIVINPTNIEKFVKARQRLGDARWTGPTRTFIVGDLGLSAYVRAREDERLKPDRPHRPTKKYKIIEDAIASIREVELQQLLRHEIENGRAAARKFAALTATLRDIPGVSLDEILGSLDGNALASRKRIATTSVTGELGHTDREIVASLLSRLLDAEEMRRAGLELDGNRLRIAFAPRTTIVRPDEMSVLKRLAGRPATDQ